jgi:alpha-tubulin suppressor-like RCC1 family protein
MVAKYKNFMVMILISILTILLFLAILNFTNQTFLSANLIPNDGELPVIGSQYGGGTVFYILQNGDYGYEEGKVKGLIAFPEDKLGLKRWGDNGIYVYGTSTSLGSGFNNTQRIVQVLDDYFLNDYAAYQSLYTIDGTYSDWYLPSRDELKIMQVNKAIIPGITPNGFYWSSSEYTENSSSKAWVIDFGTGVMRATYDKSYPHRVRPVRSFELDLRVTGLDSSLYGWGGKDIKFPTQIGEGDNWEFVARGESHSLAIKDGKLYGWGQNGGGGIDSTYTNKDYPIQIGIDNDWSAVTVGNQHSLGIRKGKLYGWGTNHYCQLGNGREGVNPRLEGCTRVYEPTRIGEFSDWDMVEAGYDYSYGIREGKLYAWGSNRNILGFGYAGNNYITVPTQVGVDSDWLYISTSSASLSYMHTMGIKNGGELYGWGSNQFGKIGNGATVDVLSPTKIGEYNDWTLVSVGPIHSLGIREGKLYSWGGAGRQLGLGSQNTDVLLPTQVGTLDDWSAIEVGYKFSLGIRRRELYAWGDANYMHNGTGGHANKPTKVGTYNDWEKISTSGRYSLAIRKIRTVPKPMIINKMKVFSKPEYVELVPPEGAEIRYTLDGSLPDYTSPIYTEKILIEEDSVLKAIAYKEGMKPSNIYEAEFVLMSADCDGDGVVKLNDIVIAMANKGKDIQSSSILANNCKRKGYDKIESKDISNIYSLYRRQK